MGSSPWKRWKKTVSTRCCRPLLWSFECLFLGNYILNTPKNVIIKCILITSEEISIMPYKSLIDVLDRFPDEKSCALHLEKLRWPHGIICQHCGSSEKIHSYKSRMIYKCGMCKTQFSVRRGTIFEESRLPLRKWFAASWLMTESRKGISRRQLAREIGVTQKTLGSCSEGSEKLRQHDRSRRSLGRDC